MHPLARVLDDPSVLTAPPELKSAALDALCFLLRQLRGDFVIFVPLIKKVGGLGGWLAKDTPEPVCACVVCLVRGRGDMRVRCVPHFNPQIMNRHRLTHSAFDNLVALLLKDFRALDDPSIPMPGGGIGGVGGSLGNLARDFASTAGEQGV